MKKTILCLAGIGLCVPLVADEKPAAQTEPAAEKPAAPESKRRAPGSGSFEPWSRISRYDEDKDGTVTKDEFSGPAHVLERFDTDKDGSLTKDEVTKVMAKGGQMRGSKGAKGGKAGKGGKGAKLDNAPKVGDTLPEVSALKHGTDERVDLSDPKRLTVLVFGSHT